MANLVPFNTQSNYNTAVSEAKANKAKGWSMQKNIAYFVHKFPPLGNYPSSLLLLMLKAGYNKMDAATALKLIVGVGQYQKAQKVLQLMGFTKEQEGHVSEILKNMGGEFANHYCERLTGITADLAGSILSGDVTAIVNTLSAVPAEVMNEVEKGLKYIGEGASTVLGPVSPESIGEALGF